MRRYGPLIVLALTVGACSEDGGESGPLDTVWEWVGDFFGGIVRWSALFLLLVLVAAAALILPATWLRRRFAPDDDEDDWDWDEND